MRGAVSLVALLVAVVAAGAALRLADLDNRPMHCDEAVHAVKFGRLLENGHYVYDPHEYHGPTLNYLTLPIARLASADRLTEVTETHLRLLPAIFGIALVAVVWPLADGLGRTAALVAALLAAVSPALVFYSRYYIQETLLVFFTSAAIVALWRYRQLTLRRESGDASADRGRRHRGGIWLVAFGVSVGMMHATKESCVIALFAVLLAAVTAWEWWRRPGWKRLAVAALVAAVPAVMVSAFFFSSFFQNPRGVLDSYATFSQYVGRALGEGTAGRHDKPPHYYIRLLFWWHEPGGRLWTEISIAVLALVGLAAAIAARSPAVPGLLSAKPDQPGERGDPSAEADLPDLALARFLAVYALTMALVYSLIPYKTPWCALGFLHAMILLAGVGAAWLIHRAPHRGLRALALVAVLAASGHLAWQAYLASYPACADPTNPYVYAHTTTDAARLARRVNEFVSALPREEHTAVQVICPDDDYWPLPWYLRDLPRVGFSSHIPPGPPAPILIAQPALEPALVNHLYVEQPPGKRHLYVPIAQQNNGDWQLRPHVPLLLFVRLDAAEAYRNTSRPDM